jgi:hypothetical protein
MFGQWALGSNSLGEPEEFVTVAPIATVCTVWIVSEENTEAAPVTASVVDQEAF